MTTPLSQKMLFFIKILINLTYEYRLKPLFEKGFERGFILNIFLTFILKSKKRLFRKF